MNDKALDLSRQLVAPHMIDAGRESLRTNHSLAHSLIAQRRLPADPWPQPLIEQFLMQLASMDSNNFVGHAGGGEREGRVYSALVARRHWYMTHGIGRSGDLTADQPKAAGSSLLAKLCNCMALDAMKAVGVAKAQAAVVVPLATGMSLSLVLQALRQSRPKPEKAKYVIWPRIDQKTSLKCITAAGLVPVVVQLRPLPSGGDDGDGKQRQPTDAASMLAVHHDDVAAAIDDLIARHPEDGVDCIAGVLCTTSCFAPRAPDDVLAVSRVASARSVPVVVNNAYGLQSAFIARRLNAALETGAVVACVQSTDKNFLTPVGGAVIAGEKAFVGRVAALYPGRASAAPVVDLFVTLLEMGRSGWLAVQRQRTELMPAFLAAVEKFAADRGERVLRHDRNDISVAITVRNYGAADAGSDKKPKKSAASLGAELFRHRITGPKVILPGPGSAKKLCGVTFDGYGTHSDAADGVPPMLVVACAVGMTRAELDTLMVRLEAAYPRPSAGP